MPTRIGIDIGGTKVNIALFGEGGDCLLERRLATGLYDETVHSIVQACRDICQEDTLGVGIGCTGPLEKGVVMNSDTLPDWKGHNLQEDISETLGYRVVLENDADAALVGELFEGAARTYCGEVVAMLTFGTGVGGAVWTGRGIFRGAYGEHPEIGHMPVLSDGPQCYCGLKGCLEVVSSGPALNESGDFDRARAGIRQALWALAHNFRPAAVVLGGGVMDAHSDRIVPFSVLAPEEAPMILRPMRVVKAELGNRAGVVGAARLLDLE